MNNPNVRAAVLLAAPILALLALMTLLGSVGKDPAPDTLTALGLIVSGVGAPVLVCVVLLASAMGWGSLLRRAFQDSPEAWTIQLGLGIALLMTLTLTLGAIGLLVAPVSIGVVLVGLGLLAWQSRGAKLELASAKVSRVWLLGLPSAALLLLAALSPPGWLWDSEYGGYDVLSYHLRLPQEWLAAGKIAPPAHNVYAFLPSGMEGIFALIGSFTLAPTGDAGASSGLLAGSGWRAIAAQIFHASLALVSAWTMHAFVRRALARAGVEAQHAGRCGATAGVALLATPWVVVVGSMAYNEMGVTALGGAAMLVAIEDKVRPAWRSALSGVLVGGACAAKPTAIFLVVPVVGALLLGSAPARDWFRLVAPGVVVGALTLAPWLVRNAAHGGNPVFPQMTSVFGNAHWDDEQVQRYTGAHAFDGGFADRVRTLVWTSPDAPEDAPSVRRWRGAMNPQFGAIFPAALLAGVIALIPPTTRRWSALLLVGLGAQAIAWMALTHLQSRFLIPALLPAAALMGLALGGVRARRSRGPLGAAWVIVIAAQSAMGVWIYLGQRGGRPNFGLLGGVPMMRGDGYDAELGSADPTAYMNHELAPGAQILYVGDSAALYNLHGVVVSTTWDRSALGEVARELDDPAQWSDALRAQGVTHVYVDLGEVRRLTLSGWRDPAVTTESLAAWLESLGEPIQTWPEEGAAMRLLYRLGE